MISNMHNACIDSMRSNRTHRSLYWQSECSLGFLFKQTQKHTHTYSQWATPLFHSMRPNLCRFCRNSRSFKYSSFLSSMSAKTALVHPSTIRSRLIYRTYWSNHITLLLFIIENSALSTAIDDNSTNIVAHVNRHSNMCTRIRIRYARLWMAANSTRKTNTFECVCSMFFSLPFGWSETKKRSTGYWWWAVKPRIHFVPVCAQQIFWINFYNLLKIARKSSQSLGHDIGRGM